MKKWIPLIGVMMIVIALPGSDGGDDNHESHVSRLLVQADASVLTAFATLSNLPAPPQPSPPPKPDGDSGAQQ